MKLSWWMTIMEEVCLVCCAMTVTIEFVDKNFNLHGRCSTKARRYLDNSDHKIPIGVQ